MIVQLLLGLAQAGHVPLEEQPEALRPLASAVMGQSVRVSACFESAERAGIPARGEVEWLVELSGGEPSFRRASSAQLDNARLLGCLDGALAEVDYGTISGVYVVPLDFDAGLLGFGAMREASSADLEAALSRGVGDCVARSRRTEGQLEGQLEVSVALREGRSEVVALRGGSHTLETCVRSVLSGVPVLEGVERSLDYRVPLGPEGELQVAPGDTPKRIGILE